MKIVQTKSYQESAAYCADLFLQALKQKPNLLMGLATGESVVGIYDRLAGASQEGFADFSQARSVNLDEYIGCSKEDSYRYFMEKNLFSRINMPPEHITIADYEEDPDMEVARMQKFFAENQVDIQLLGLGGNGHIGFNEPSEQLSGGTHRVQLAGDTVQANARFFASADMVPKEAITMGMGDIMKAKSIVMLVKGESKRQVLQALLNNDVVTTKIPASFLRLHPDVTLVFEESLVK